MDFKFKIFYFNSVCNMHLKFEKIGEFVEIRKFHKRIIINNEEFFAFFQKVQT